MFTDKLLTVLVVSNGQLRLVAASMGTNSSKVLHAQQLTSAARTICGSYDSGWVTGNTRDVAAYFVFVLQQGRAAAGDGQPGRGVVGGGSRGDDERGGRRRQRTGRLRGYDTWALYVLVNFGTFHQNWLHKEEKVRPVSSVGETLNFKSYGKGFETHWVRDPLGIQGFLRVG